jgi:Xaa-Pro aminopeptidase
MDKLTRLTDIVSADAVLIPTELDCFYFTGYRNDFCYLVSTPDFVRYYTDSRYYDEAADKVDCEVIKVTSENALETVAKDLAPYKRVGLDENKLYYRDFKAISSKINKEFDFIGEAVTKVRSLKDTDEIIMTETAIDITDSAFTELLQFIREGITERELGNALDSIMLTLGAECPAFDTIAAFSENAAIPHWHKSDRKLVNGDIILLDFGARYNGYHADMTRMISFGKAKPEYKKAYAAVLEANMKAIEGIRPGMTASFADAIARDCLAKYGLADKFSHSLGHGVGVEIHEFPRLAPSENSSLMSGMLFTIEPGVYINGEFGIRIEDTVLLTDKVNVLTQTDKKLLEI